MKNCSNKDCKQSNPQELTNFHKGHSTNGSLQSMCKICFNLSRKEKRKANPEKFRASERASVLRHAARIKAREYKVIRGDNRRFRSGKYTAIKRGYIWDIDIVQWKEIISTNECYYCQGRLPETGHALDRKNNSIGYIFDNLVPCCRNCNKIKNDLLSFEEMVEVSKLLKQLRKGI